MHFKVDYADLQMVADRMPPSVVQLASLVKDAGAYVAGLLSGIAIYEVLEWTVQHALAPLTFGAMVVLAAVDKTALVIKIANALDTAGDIANIRSLTNAARALAPGKWGGLVAETADEAIFLRSVAATFGETSVFTSAKRFRGSIVIQRSDIPWSVENVRQMAGGWAPRVKNHRGEWKKVNLHHVGRQDGKLIEIIESHNRYDHKTGGPLHIPGPGGPIRDSALTPAHWRQRLLEAIDVGLVPENVLREAGLLK